MKSVKGWLLLCLWGAFTLSATSPTWAAGSKKPTETLEPPQAESDEPFVLNPDSLRTQLLDKNFDLIYGANRVHQSRVQLQSARSALLPTLRLGVNFLTYGVVGLAFSGADFLLNFLIPTVWFKNFEQKALVKAEESAYLTLKLNQYNSALNMYFGVLSDLELRNFLHSELNDAYELEYLAEQALQNGYGSEVDLAQAVAQAAQTQYELLKIESLLAQQFGQIKKGLSLPQSQELQVELVRIPRADLEDMDFKRAYETVYELSPERTQLDGFMDAAYQGRWAAIFGFIQSLTASASVVASSGGRTDGIDMSFNKLNVNGSMDLGFHHYPRIRLSNAKIDELRVRKEELRFEIERIVTVALQQIDFAKEAFAQAQLAESKQDFVYEAQKALYLEGRLAFSDLVQTKSRLQRATLDRVQAETSLQVLRTALHRMSLSDRFEGIQSCHVSELKERDFARLSRSKKSVAEICAESLN
jgi:outer membrane protein TolC